MTEKITSEEFDALVAKSRMKEKAVAMMRAVLVDGRTLADVSHEYGVARQIIFTAIQRLQTRATSDSMFTYTGVPEAFVAIDAIVDQHKGRKLLTPKQFDELAAQSRLEPHSLELARGVLVEGRSNIELARENGIARHLPWQAAQRLLKRFDPSVEKTRVYQGSDEMFAAIDALGQQTGKAPKK